MYNNDKNHLSKESDEPKKAFLFFNYSWWVWAILICILGIGSYFILQFNKIAEGSNDLNKDTPQKTNNVPINTPDSLKNLNQNPKKQPIAKQNKIHDLLNPQHNKKLLAIANELYKSPDIEGLRNDKGNSDDLINKAQKTWADHDLKKAINILESIDEKNPRYIYSQLLLGHAYYQTKNYQKAKFSFNTVIQKHKMPYEEEAEWNLLITLVAQNKIKTPFFKKLLEKVIDEKGHAYQDKAVDLDKRIR